MYPYKQIYTLPGLLQYGYIVSSPNARVSSREAVCTTFMMALVVTWPWHRPMTYHMRSGHANSLAIPTLYNEY